MPRVFSLCIMLPDPTLGHLVLSWLLDPLRASLQCLGSDDTYLLIRVPKRQCCNFLQYIIAVVVSLLLDLMYVKL